MRHTQITSTVRLASEVLYSGCFEVPWHQRYYNWKEQVSELLFDLKGALDTGKACYFLGSIMLVTTADAKLRRINDGQQRLITLSLLIAAFCRRFAQKRSLGQSRETLALRALFDRPDNQTSRLADSARYTVRIEPPRNDKSRYEQILRGHEIGTNGLLTDAWKTVDGFVEEMSKSARETFFDFLMQKVEISVLDVPGDVDANLVFEALNARGKPLDDVDLIRNRLYSYFSESDDAARRETVHGNLENTVVVLRNTNAVQEYFRCYLQCRYGHLQKMRLYREARLAIDQAVGRRDSSNYVFDLVNGLGRNDSIELFRTIASSSPSQSLDKLLPVSSGKQSLTVLLGELQGYKVSHPLVFALLHRLIGETNKDTKRKAGRVAIRSLKNLASFVMRTAFVAPKFEPSKFEEAFANCARTVFGGSNIASLNILEDLKQNDEWNVVNNKNFIRRMTEMELRDNKKALRYLFGINAKSQVGSDALREKRCSVEHILPLSKQYWRSWTGFKDVNPEEWVYRTGNLVVVSKQENRAEAKLNQAFAAKQRAFKNSPLQMPRTVAAIHSNWTPETIDKRSQQLAREAALTWQFYSGR